MIILMFSLLKIFDNQLVQIEPVCVAQLFICK